MEAAAEEHRFVKAAKVDAKPERAGVEVEVEEEEEDVKVEVEEVEEVKEAEVEDAEERFPKAMATGESNDTRLPRSFGRPRRRGFSGALTAPPPPQPLPPSLPLTHPRTAADKRHMTHASEPAGNGNGSYLSIKDGTIGSPRSRVWCRSMRGWARLCAALWRCGRCWVA
jgi:hypothetical protein